MLIAVLGFNAGCSAIKGEEKSRFRNTNRTAYQQPMGQPGLAPVAAGPEGTTAPRVDTSWGGSLSTR